MFEQVNKKLKRRISKAVSIVLCAAMLVTALPAELLGGVASVEAAEVVKTTSTDVEASSKVVYSQGDWEVPKDGDGETLVRETKWDFNTDVVYSHDGKDEEGNDQYKLINGLEDVTLSDGESLKGITGKAVTWKRQYEGNLSLINSANKNLGEGDALLAIPLDKKTESVDVAFTLFSKSNGRILGIGDGTNWLQVYHNQSEKTYNKTKEVTLSGKDVIHYWKANSNKTAYLDTELTKIYTFDSTNTTDNMIYKGEDETQKSISFFTDEETGEKWLYMIVGDATASSKGETKFMYLAITETRPASGGGDELEPFSMTYDFSDQSIVKGAKGDNISDDSSSEDSVVTIKAGTDNGYGFNDTEHGSIFKAGNSITLDAEKLGEGYTITSVAVGGCKYTSHQGKSDSTATATVTVVADEAEIAKDKDTYTANCASHSGSTYAEITEEPDKVNGYVFDIEDGATKVTLTFGGNSGTYIPYITVSGTKPKANEVKVTVNIKDDDNLLDGATVSLVKKGSTEKVTVVDGDEKDLPVDAIYSAVIEKDGKEVEGLAALFNGKSTVQVADETDTITITVVSTVVEVTPTFTDDSTALGDNELWAVSANDAQKLTNGVATKLAKETEYTLEVRNGAQKLEDWAVSVNGTESSKFTTGTGATQAISVKISHVTVVNVTAVISPEGMLGANKLYLVEGTADGEDIPVSEDPMELKPNTEYSLEIRTAQGAAVTSLKATVAGKDTYKTGNKDEEIEILISVPATGTTAYGKAYLETDTFAKVNGGNVTATEGQVLPGTNILYKTYVASGVTYDSQLRFRNGNVLWLPLKDDTTKITYAQTSNANQPRYVHIGYKDSGIKVQMKSGEASVTIDDITDLIVTDEAGKKYLPIVSDSDVKLDGIKWTEYNPVNTVTVTGKVDGVKDATQTINTIRFVNLTNRAAKPVTAAIDAEGNYSVELRRVAGETKYAAVLPLVTYKIDDTNQADQFVLIGNDPTAEKDFTVVSVPVAKVTGKITGIRKELVKGDGLGVSLIPWWNEALDPIELTLTSTDEGYSYAEVLLEQGKSYNVELTNADDDIVKDRVEVSAENEVTADIVAEAKPVVAVTGNFITSDREDAAVTKITFTNIKTPDYTYTFNVTGTGTSYTAELREAEYKTSVECKDGYEAFDKVSVKDVAVTNDVYLQGPVDETPVEYKATVTVGAGEDKDFEKIADAVKYISRMTRENDERVTIVLDENKTYMEQLVINTPNITIEGNGSTITWYYGGGFSYYSAKLDAVANTAYYDEAYAVDKYNMQAISQNPGHWGATVNLLADANGFAAKDLIFENSLNYRVTEEELKDGAGENASSSILARKADLDVFARAAKERASALYIQADDTTYKNCTFLGEQDTLYTGDANENSYFVDCTIEGNTDYIYGDGNAVFDNCVLSMYCYSDEDATDSIIVANKAKAKHGYLFSDCEVVRSTNTGAKSTSSVMLVRAWDKGTIYFMNTKVADENLIHEKGYKDMNAKVADATYYEYNTHTSEGPVDMSKREPSKGHILTEAEANALRMTTFFDGWRPIYFEGTVDVDSVTVEVLAPRAGATVKTDATTATPGVTNLSAITWYEGNATEAYTGEKYKANTTFRAEMTVDAAEGYVFFSEAKAVVEGADSVVTTLSEDKKTLTIKATYTTGDEEKLTTIFKLPINASTTSGLKKGRYAGGFTLMEDMGTYGSAGFSNVTGENNHKTGKLIEVSIDPVKAKEIAGENYDVWVQGLNNPLGEDGKGAKGIVPVSGSVLMLNALEDGTLTLVCQTEKHLSFIDATDPSNITADETLGLILGNPESETSLWKDQVYTIQVKKGHTYYFYAHGSKLVLCAASVEYDGEIEDNGPVAPGTEDGNDKPGGTEDGTDDGGDTSFDGDDWKKVAKPVIVKHEYSSTSTSSDGKDKDGKLTLTVKADVSSKGGSSLDVTVQKVGETTSETKTSKAKQDTHVFEFAASRSSKYKVTAALKRKGMDDKTTTVFITVNADGSTTMSKGRDGLYVELVDEDKDYVYTGSAIKPAITVWNGDEQLTEGVDYTVKYSNNVKAAKWNIGKKAPTITVTGKGKYTGKTTQTFTIQQKDLSDDDVRVGGKLDGSLVVAENTKISPVLVYRGVVLKAGANKDFILETNITKPTKANSGEKITIKGANNNYTGELELTLDVRAKSELKKISAVKVDKKAGLTYDGEEKEVVLTEVKAGKQVATKDDPLYSYEVVYNGDRISAGTQKFTVIGMGLCTGSKTSSFKIDPRKNAPLKLTNDPITTRTFNSAGVTFTDELTVTDEGLGVDLVLGKDYKVSYSGNKKVGTGKYTVTFLGNYKGSSALKNTFNITQADFADLDVSAVAANKAYKKPNQYKSAPFVLVDGVALKKSDYTVKYYFGESEMSKNNKVTLADGETSATVRVVVEGKKNYKGTVETTFEVQTGKNDISKVKITPQAADGKKQSKVDYSGEAVYPAKIEIKQGKNVLTTLTSNGDGTWSGEGDSNYEVIVVNNIAKGKATIIVNGAGDNVGSKTATFSVVARNLGKLTTEEKENFWDDFKGLQSIIFWPGLQSVQ